MCGVEGLTWCGLFWATSFFSFRVVGTKRVRSALKLRICGLASIVAAIALPDAFLAKVAVAEPAMPCDPPRPPRAAGATDEEPPIGL